MEIFKWHLYIVLSCAILPYCAAKPVSLNDIIAAESKQKQNIESTQKPKPLPDTSERFSLNKVLKQNSHKLKKLGGVPESLWPRGKKVSSLKYRKTFQIKSPLKPKRLKHIQKPRYKRRNQSRKREIYGNETLNKKYIPLLRSLSMLFDNILSSDSSELRDIKNYKYKLNRHFERNNESCTCARQHESRETKSSKEAIISTTPSSEDATSTENSVPTTEVPGQAPDNATSSDISDLRPNTDIPILFAGDTVSAWGDDYGFRQRSSTTNHASTERNISWNYRNSERDTSSGENKPSSTDDEKNSDSYSRNDTRGRVFQGNGGGTRLRGIGDDRSPVYRRKTEETNEVSETQNNTGPIRGDVIELKREIEHEMGGDKTKSSTTLPQFVPGYREYVPSNQIGNNAKSIQSKEVYEEGIVNVEHGFTNDKRFVDRSSTSTEEDKKTSGKNATVISIQDLSNPILMLKSNPKQKTPYVTIIDGYSVARDKNGANKLAEQSIRYHS